MVFVPDVFVALMCSLFEKDQTQRQGAESHHLCFSARGFWAVALGSWLLWLVFDDVKCCLLVNPTTAEPSCWQSQDMNGERQGTAYH